MSKDLTDAECTDGEILRELRMTGGVDDLAEEPGVVSAPLARG